MGEKPKSHVVVLFEDRKAKVLKDERAKKLEQSKQRLYQAAKTLGW